MVSWAARNVVAGMGVAVGVLALLSASPSATAEMAGGGVASEWLDGHASRVRIIAGRPGGGQKNAGGQVVAGVEITLEPGWKTYWRVPGEAGGVPPEFDWSKSNNVAEAKVTFPAPKRLSDSVGDTIGYKERVVFPVEVTPADPSKPVELALEFAFGVCREICVPADASLSLKVPREASGVPEAIRAALEKVPRKEAQKRAGDPEVAGYDADFSGKSPRVVLYIDFGEMPEKGDLFAVAPDGLYLPMAKRASGESPKGGNARFVIDLAETVDADELKGKTITLTLVGAKGQSERPLQLN